MYATYKEEKFRREYENIFKIVTLFPNICECYMSHNLKKIYRAVSIFPLHKQDHFLSDFISYGLIKNCLSY
jgi:hypothetical protein